MGASVGTKAARICHICRVRAERLLRILLLLEAYESLTAGELARRLEVSARTIQRDLDSLSLAGVPVYANRGHGGGWTLARDYRTRLNGLTPAEAMTVFVGTTAHVLADLGLDAAADSAFAKLLSALPANARKDAEYARARVLVDDAVWQGAGEASPHLAVIRRALWEERRVQVCYAGRPARLAPLGLVAKGSTWYLVAAGDDGEIRIYRVPKITSAVPTGQAFERPRGFDLAVHWAGACERFFATRPVYPVRRGNDKYAKGRTRLAGPARGGVWRVLDAGITHVSFAASMGGTQGRVAWSSRRRSGRQLVARAKTRRGYA
jgi:predicted DNA-binding transcriptional regulator YafY